MHAEHLQTHQDSQDSSKQTEWPPTPVYVFKSHLDIIDKRERRVVYVLADVFVHESV